MTRFLCVLTTNSSPYLPSGHADGEVPGADHGGHAQGLHQGEQLLVAPYSLDHLSIQSKLLVINGIYINKDKLSLGATYFKLRKETDREIE